MILTRTKTDTAGEPGRALRVALVTEYFYPHFGGVTEHVQNLAVHLRASGHAAVVITSRVPGHTSDLPGVYRIGRSVVLLSNGSFARVTAGFGLKRAIRDILREERIDIVHLHGPLTPTLGLVAPDAAHELGTTFSEPETKWARPSPAWPGSRREVQGDRRTLPARGSRREE